MAIPTLADRSSGVLLHPTSLSGAHGVGTLGEEARAFVDWLAAAGQRWWQILPLGPPSAGPSPYQTTSALAGNPMLISLAELARAGLLDEGDLTGAPAGDPDHVDFGAVEAWREPRLRKASDRFWAREDAMARARAFAQQSGDWIADYTTFASLKRRHGGVAWTALPEGLRDRVPEALSEARHADEAELRFQVFLQIVFDEQWLAVREHAHARGIAILGDVPIFVAHDSADVWAHRDLFHLDDRGEQTVVAGVPPDVFSKSGQRWGNALYRWDKLRERGYDWWVARLRGALRHTDALRLDHFIGFSRYWEIPASSATAVDGRWVPGPGEHFFEVVREALGGLPLVAEDLGLVTDEVHALRDRFELPGMRILQFSFGQYDGAMAHRPHSYPKRSVAYTGTHDNDTTRGWLADPTVEKESALARRYCGSDGREAWWDLVRMAELSASTLAMVPMQDVLGLGTEARMNLPGTTENNWRWRMRADALSPELAKRLRELSELYGRA